MSYTAIIITIVPLSVYKKKLFSQQDESVRLSRFRSLLVLDSCCERTKNNFCRYLTGSALYFNNVQNNVIGTSVLEHCSRQITSFKRHVSNLLFITGTEEADVISPGLKFCSKYAAFGKVLNVSKDLLIHLCHYHILEYTQYTSYIYSETILDEAAP